MGLLAKLSNIFMLIVFTLLMSGCNLSPGSKSVDNNHPSEIVVETSIGPLAYTKSQYPSISIIVRDANSSSVAGAKVEVITDSGRATLKNSTTNSSGRTSIDWTFGDNTGNASLIINASLNGFVATKVITINLTTSTVSDLNSSITGTSLVTANGVSLSTVTISLKDEKGVGVPGITPLFSATNTGFTNSYSECSPSDTNGYSNCVFKSTKAEEKVLQLLSPVNISGDSVTFVPGPLASLYFSTQATATDTDSAFAPQPEIKGLDAFGNIITEGLTSDVKLTPYSANNCSGNTLSLSTLAGSSATSFSNGAASFLGLSPLKTSLKSLKATYERFSVCSSSISVLPGAVNSIEFDSQPSSTGVANISFSAQPVVKIYDANDNLKNNAAFFVSLTAYSDANCTIPVVDGLTALSNPVTTFNGVAAFSNLKILKTNVIRIGASDGERTVCSRPVSILPAPVSSIAFTTQPVASTTDYLFSPQPVITTYDSLGNIVTNNSASVVSLTSYDSPNCGGNILSSGMAGSTSLALSRGVASFSNVKPFTSSLKSVKASLGSITTCSNTITVFSGETASIAFTTQPSSTGNTDSNLISQPVVKMYDANLNIKPDAVSPITLRAYSDASCTALVVGGLMASANPVSSVLGIATFSEVKVLKTNVIRIGASDGVRTVCSNAISIAPGALNHMAFTDQPRASDTDTLFSSQPIVTSYDANGNILTNNSSSSLSLSAYDGASCSGNVVASALSGPTSIALINGIATFAGLKPLKTSVQSLKASIGSINTCSTILTVSPGAAASIAFTTQPSATGTTDSALVTQPMIKIFDANSNIKTDSAASITLTGYADSACTIPVAGSISTPTNPIDSSSGVASFSLIKILKTNVVRIGATDGVRTACSNPIVISAGGLSSLAFTTKPVATNTDSNFTTQPVLTAYDANGNILTNDSATSLTLAAYDSTDCSGNLVSSGLSGVTTKSLTSGMVSFSALKPLKTSIQSIKASAGTISTCSGPVVVSPGAAASLAFSTQPSASGNTDSVLDTQPVIQILDTHLNLKTDSSSSITLTAYSDSSCSTAVSNGLMASTNPLSAASGVATFSNVKVLKTNVVRIGATDGTRTICSSAISIDQGALATLAFTTQPVSTNTDNAFTTQPVVSAYDSSNNILANDSTSTVALTAYSEASCAGTVVSSALSGMSSKALTDGMASFANLKPISTDIKSIKATIGTVTACSDDVTVAPGSASLLAFTTQPSSAVTTDSVMASQPVIKIYDAHSNIKTNSSASITLTAYSDATCTTAVAGGLTALANPSAAVQGVVTIANLKILKTNVVRIGASDGTRTTCSNALSVAAGALSSLAFTTAPVATTTDSAFTTQPVVTGYDASGNILENDSISNVSLTAYDSASCSGLVVNAGLSGSTSSTLTNGVASFSSLRPLKTSIQSVKATVGSVETCSNNLTVYPGAASSIAFATQPAPTGDTDSALSTQPVVNIYDANSNLKTDYLSSINLTAYSDASCTTAVSGGLSASSNPATAVGGIASFSGVRVLKTNVIRIGASDGVRTVCSNALSIGQGVISTLAFTTQPVASNTDSTFTTQPVVTAYDASGNVLTNDSTSTLTLTAYDTAACAGNVLTSSMTGTTTKLLSSGVTSFTSVSPVNTSIQSLKATVGSVSVCSNSLTVAPGAASSIAFSTQPSPTSTTDAALSIQPVLKIFDANLNIKTDSTAALTLTGFSDATCTSSVSGGLSATSNPVTVVNGVATFAAVKILKTNVIRIGATDGTRTICSDAVAISAGSLSTLAFTTQPVATNTDSNFSTMPALTAYDVNGNVLTNDSTSTVTLAAYDGASCSGNVVASGLSGTSSLSLTNGVASFSGLKPLFISIQSLKASIGAVTICSNALSVSPGGASSVAFTTQPSSSGTTDAVLSTQPVIKVYDANSNIKTDSSASITLTGYSDASCTSAVSGGLSASANPVSAVSGVASFANVKVLKTNVIRIGASDGTRVTCSSSMVISAGALSTIAFTTSPPTSNTTDAVFATQPVVKAYDANGNVLTNNSSSLVSLEGYSGYGCGGSALTSSFSGSNPLNLTSGVATFSLLRPIKTMSSIKASIGAVTVCAGYVPVYPGAASSIAFSTQPSSTGSTDSALSTQPVVSAYDANSNLKWDVSTPISLKAYSDASCTTEVAGGISATANPVSTVGGLSTFASVKVLKTNVIRIGASDGTRTACSSAMVISQGALATLAFTTQPVATTTDTAFSTQPVITAYDANGNTLSNDSTSSIALTAYDSASCAGSLVASPLSGTSTKTLTTGVASFTALIPIKTTVKSLKATSGAVSVCSSTLTVSPGAASSLAYTTQPSSTGTTDAALAAQPVIKVYDANSNIKTDSAASITLAAYSDASCTTLVSGGLSATTNPVTAVSGVATFANVKILKTNVIRIRATDGTRTICSSAMVISAGAISTLAFTAQPVATNTDTAFSTQPVVAAYDANGNVLTNNSSSSIALTAYDAASCAGSLVASPMSGTATKTLTSGVATFSALIPIKTTVKSLKATSGAVSVCSSTLTVSPGAAASLAYTTQPSATGTTDAALAAQPVIKVYDANSNIKTDSAASITLAAYSDASCTTLVSGGLSATTNPVTAVSGVATFANVKVLKTNVIRIRATDGTRTICSSAMVISAGAASSLAFTTQPVATNTDTAFSAQPVVTAYDANGNTLSNDSTSSVALTAYDTASCAGSVVSSSMSGTTTKTLASGIATFTALTPIKTTVKSLKATSGLVSICSNTLTVSPGAAASLAFTTQPSSTGTTDTALSSQPVLTVYDANANIKTDSTASLTLSAYSDATCTSSVASGLSATTNPVTATSGVATFTNVKALKTNVIRIGATDGTRTICSNAMVISAGAISTLAFTTQPVATNTDTVFSSQPVVAAYDSNGNVLVNNSTSTLALTAYDTASCAGNLVSSAFSGVSSLTLSSGVASFAALKPLKTSIKSIKATVGPVTACSNTLTVSAGAAANIAITSGNSQSAAVNTALSAFSVYVTDANSNAVDSTSVSWTILSGAGSLSAASSLTNASGVASSTLTLGTNAGANSVTASIGSANVTFSATASAGQAATIAISAGDAQSATAGSPLPVQLTVLVKDAYSNPVSAQTINWSNLTGTGSLSAATSNTDSSGLASITYTLGVAAGTNTVSATVNGQAMLSKTFTATGLAGAATKMALSSGNNQSSFLGTGLINPLVVNVQDSSNNYVSGAIINWSATNGASLSSASSTSGANGNSTINITSVGYTGGAQTATATLNGTTTSVTFNYNALVEQPANLVGTAQDGSAALTWSAVTGATSYKIYTSTTSGSGFTLLDSSATESYNATLANGVTYSIYVTAVSGTMESDPSNEISVTPVSGTSTAAGWLRQIGKATGKETSDPINTTMIGDDYCKSIAIDSKGSIYCAGSTNGAFGEINNNFVSQNGAQDAFVMKLNSSGEVEWITQLGANTRPNGGDQDDSCESVTFDNDGYVYCAGYTLGSIGERNSGGSDAFVVKISPAGSIEWLKQLGAESVAPSRGFESDDSFTSIKVHTDGSIYTAGYTHSSIADSNNGNQDAMIAKFDANGNYIWIYQLGQNSGLPNTLENDVCMGLALDLNGSAYCGGYTAGDLGDGMSGQSMDSFVMKVGLDGSLNWVTQYGGGHKTSGTDMCHSITVDENGSTYCAGATTGVMNPYGNANLGGWDAYIMKLDINGNYQWISQIAENNGLKINTSNNEVCRGVGLDDQGSVYCSGTTDGAFSEQAGGGGSDVMMIKLDRDTGGIRWARQLGNSTASGDNSGYDFCLGMGLDAQGSAYCAGYTNGSPGEENANIGSYDAFILKLNPVYGDIEWVKQFGVSSKKQFLNNIASNNDACLSTTKDSEGNVYCAGYTVGSLGETSGGSQDALMMKLDPSGNIIWIKQLGSDTLPSVHSSQADICYGVAVDKSGNVFCAGSTTGSLGESNSSGNTNAFVIKLDKDGNLQWIKQIGERTSVPGGDAGSWSACQGISVDDNGNSFCAGYTGASLGDVNSAGAINQSSDAFVMKLTAEGNIEWITQLGKNTDVPGGDRSTGESCSGVTNDQEGNVYCTGQTSGSLGEKAGGGGDAFVMKLNSKGNIQWITQLGGETKIPGGNTKNSETGISITVDASGNVYSTGYTFGSLGEENGGSSDVFIMSLNSSGTLQWIRQFGQATKTPKGDATSSDSASGIASDKKGNIYLSGYTAGSLGEMNSAGYSDGPMDGFVTKLNSSGEIIWFSQLGQETIVPSGVSTSSEYCMGIAVDNSGNSFCAGYTKGSLGEENAGGNDVFIMKLNSEGKLK